jgi:hypothetical protein
LLLSVIRSVHCPKHSICSGGHGSVEEPEEPEVDGSVVVLPSDDVVAGASVVEVDASPSVVPALDDEDVEVDVDVEDELLLELDAAPPVSPPTNSGFTSRQPGAAATASASRGHAEVRNFRTST